MISFVTGDLFESPAQTLVNTVNTRGVMGKGIALRFKQIYPEMFAQYRQLCERKEFKIGSLFVYRTPNKVILNFPTKDDWRRPSRPEYIEAGLRTFVRNYDKLRIRSVAFPPLGCGNGELNFDEVVRPIMEAYLQQLPIPVFIYPPAPKGTPPEHLRVSEVAAWLRENPRDLSFEEVWYDLQTLTAEKKRFRTLNGKGSFEAAFIPEADGIRIWPSGNARLASKEEFFHLWVQLREAGLLATRGASSTSYRAASFTHALLAQLPYVRVVSISDDFDSFMLQPSLALQLLPSAIPDRADSVQQQLL